MRNKTILSLPVLSALATAVLFSTAAQANPVDMSAAITASSPQCGFTVMPEVESVAAAYTVTGDETDGYTGAWGGTVAPASYLISVPAQCEGVPALKIQLPSPTKLAGKYNKEMDSAGIRWYANSILHSIDSYSQPDGSGTATFVGGATARYNRGNRVMANATITKRTYTGSHKAYLDNTEYQFITGIPLVAGTDGGQYIFFQGANGPISGSTMDGVATVLSVPAQPGVHSTRLQVGAVFGSSPVTDKGSLVNGITVSWSGTLTVDLA